MGSCCAKDVDIVAPSHRPFRVPPGLPPGKDAGLGSSAAAQNRPTPTLVSGPGRPPDLPGRPPDLPLPETLSPALAAMAAMAPAAVFELEVELFEQRERSRSGRRSKFGQELPASCLAFDAPESILATGSLVQNFCITPWHDQDLDMAQNFGLEGANTRRPELKTLKTSAGESEGFLDTDGLLELSSRQREALNRWQRMPDLILAGKDKAEPSIFSSSPCSRIICQGLVGDCSFLSALASLAEYESKFGTPVLSSIIYPRREQAGGSVPVYNATGKYGCRLFLNGTARKVIVDDQVPVRRDGRILCAHSARPNELWVTLLEKSFAKIMGGSYDMQGSNPGTDIFHLTAWVPETVPLNEAGVSASPPIDMNTWEQVWDVADVGQRLGHCVLCAGTSEISDAAENKEANQLGHIEGVSISTGLVAHHAYPVLDCRRLGKYRLLRMRNPWGRVRWRGRFSPGHASSMLEASRLASLDGEKAPNPLAEAEADDGYFWIEWADVLRYFSHLYVSWSPRALGQWNLEAHGRFDPNTYFAHSSLPDDTHLVAFNPQFCLRLEGPLEGGILRNGAPVAVWILLSRHVRDRSELAAKYVAAHIYASSSSEEDSCSRLSCPDAPLEQGVYSNGECALVKLDGTSVQGRREFVISVSQHGCKDPFNFTLQVYSTARATLTPLPTLVPPSFISGFVDGLWSREAAGGCSNNLWQYFQNPQWCIEVPEAPGSSTLILFLECPAEHSVNLRLFRGAVARPEALRRAESSGAYRQGCCMLRLELEPGPHVLVCSTFRPGLQAGYRLAWHSDRAVAVRPQPHPFAAALQAPLEVQTQRLNPLRRGAEAGRLWKLLCLEVAGTLPVVASVCVQSQTKAGPPPKLSLLRFQANSAGSGDWAAVEPDTDQLQESFAESYFTFCGAAVLLAATLQPGTLYALDVSLPTATVTLAAGAAPVMDARIASNRPIMLELDHAHAARPRPRVGQNSV